MHSEGANTMQNEKRIKTLLTISFVCIVSSLLSGCGSFEETICKETEGQMRNGLIYLPNQQEPFTGNNLCIYENGQIKVKGYYKDGYPDGKWTAWHENGQKWVEVNYKDGKMTWWYENGQKKSKEKLTREDMDILW
jgi:major membrane immunogen (membrane-anchored lipoprotein)